MKYFLYEKKKVQVSLTLCFSDKKKKNDSSRKKHFSSEKESKYLMQYLSWIYFLFTLSVLQFLMFTSNNLFIPYRGYVHLMSFLNIAA